MPAVPNAKQAPACSKRRMSPGNGPSGSSGSSDASTPRHSLSVVVVAGSRRASAGASAASAAGGRTGASAEIKRTASSRYPGSTPKASTASAAICPASAGRCAHEALSGSSIHRRRAASACRSVSTPLAGVAGTKPRPPIARRGAAASVPLRATSKSMRRASSSSVARMLPGWRSPWVTPRRCISATSRSTERVSRMARRANSARSSAVDPGRMSGFTFPCHCQSMSPSRRVVAR